MGIEKNIEGRGGKKEEKKKDVSLGSSTESRFRICARGGEKGIVKLLREVCGVRRNDFARARTRLLWRYHDNVMPS